MLEQLFKGRKILIVAPHADDEAIGCGGTMARAAECGAEVYVLVVTVGDLKRVGDGEGVVKAEERIAEVDKVARFLNVKDSEVIMTDEHRHLRLDAIPRRDLVAFLERDARLSVSNLKPDFVFLPAPSYNQDHEAVAKAGLTACRPHDRNALPSPAGVFLYEYPPNSWCFPQDRFLPGFYVDISDHLDKKIDAYKLYESQARGGLHQNNPDNIRNLALLRGREVGVAAAEAFQVLRLKL